MLNPISRARQWLDDKFCSSESELLERDGATSQGVQIIDELNYVYERTGLFDTACKVIVEDLRELASKGTSSSLRVLEIGCRDGRLLCRVGEQMRLHGVSLELHGLEFHHNLVQLAEERSATAPSLPQFRLSDSPELASCGDHEFDLVYSLFSLHHFDRRAVETLLLATQRVTRRSFLHIDLQRSAWGAAAIWMAYTLMRCRHARGDSVLSVRRAYRANEIQAIAKSAGLETSVRPLRKPPLYWLLKGSPA